MKSRMPRTAERRSKVSPMQQEPSLNPVQNNGRGGWVFT
jgi:hypothetical protein